MRFLPWFACLCLWAPAHAQSSHYHTLQQIQIGGSGGWDYITADADHHRLYVSHGTRVEVRDSRNGAAIGTIDSTTGVHGIALDPTLHKGFISCGKLNTVLVFNPETLQAGASIAAGQNPDAILYDAFSKKIYVGNGRSHDLTVIDPATEKVIATIPLGGKPEAIVADEKHVYVNIEDKNSIAVINPQTLQVVNNWPLTSGDEPSGLAIDLKTKRLFAGCGNKTLCVVDAASGKNIAQLPIGDGCDGVVFDPSTSTVFSANGEGNITAIQEANANTFRVAATIPTLASARTITIDNNMHHLFLPAAEVKPATGGGRPQAIPGTFRVLEVGL